MITYYRLYISLNLFLILLTVLVFQILYGPFNLSNA